MSQYRVAVLGAGDRGKAYSKALKQLDKDCVLVNICDLQEERAQKGDQPGLPAGVYLRRQAVWPAL